MADDGLMTIGEFSRLVGVTPSALRYYDDCGLLVPAHVAATGYRLYTDGQRERATVIRLLREAGLSLAEVRQIVDGPSDDLRQVMRDHLARTAEQARSSAAVLHRALRTMLGSGEPWAQVRVRGPELASGIRQVRHAADRARPVGGQPDLAAVLVEIDLDEVRLVSTDRYRLALRSLRGHHVEGGCARVGVAADDLVELVPALLLADAAVLRVDGAGLTCVIDERRHALAARGHGFPDYRVVLDGLAPADARIVADRGALLRALRPVDRDQVVLMGEAAEGVAEEGVAVVHPSGDVRAVAGAWRGPRFRVAFDAVHMEDALAVSVGPDVIIELADGPRPAVVRSADHGSFTTLVMPRIAAVPDGAGAVRTERGGR